MVYQKRPPRTTVEERLLSKSKVNPSTGCWDWQRAKDRYGYGAFSLRCVARKAHRVSYELFCGPITDDQQVLHSCDNPGCINPSHLFLGSNLNNVADKVAKGRQYRGVRHHNAKLTAADITAIRALVGVKLVDIGAQFGVHLSVISLIRAGKLWTHVK